MTAHLRDEQLAEVALLPDPSRPRKAVRGARSAGGERVWLRRHETQPAACPLPGSATVHVSCSDQRFEFQLEHGARALRGAAGCSCPETVPSSSLASFAPPERRRAPEAHRHWARNRDWQARLLAPCAGRVLLSCMLPQPLALWLCRADPVSRGSRWCAACFYRTIRALNAYTHSSAAALSSGTEGAAFQLDEAAITLPHERPAGIAPLPTDRTTVRLRQRHEAARLNSPLSPCHLRVQARLEDALRAQHARCDQLSQQYDALSQTLKQHAQHSDAPAEPGEYERLRCSLGEVCRLLRQAKHAEAELKQAR